MSNIEYRGVKRATVLKELLRIGRLAKSGALVGNGEILWH